MKKSILLSTVLLLTLITGCTSHKYMYVTHSLDTSNYAQKMKTINQIRKQLEEQGKSDLATRMAIGPQHSSFLATPTTHIYVGDDDTVELELVPLVSHDDWCTQQCQEVSFSQCQGYPGGDQIRLDDCNTPIYLSCYTWCTNN